MKLTYHIERARDKLNRRIRPPNMSLTIYAFALTALTLLIYRCSKIGTRPAGYPPGPPTLPLIGNLHQMPKGKAHLQFQKWAETYGPVYSLMLGTKVMIVLNSDVAVKDLLDRRSSIYSSRPDMYIANIASGGLRFSLLVILGVVQAVSEPSLTRREGIRRRVAQGSQGRA